MTRERISDSVVDDVLEEVVSQSNPVELEPSNNESYEINLRKLFSYGYNFDPAKPNREFSRTGNTVLRQAVIKNDVNAVKILLGLCDPEVKDKDGRTPLFDAIENGFDAVVDEFLSRKVNLHVVAKNGDTPLVVAHKNDQPAIVKKLVAAKGDKLEFLLTNQVIDLLERDIKLGYKDATEFYVARAKKMINTNVSRRKFASIIDKVLAKGWEIELNLEKNYQVELCLEKLGQKKIKSDKDYSALGKLGLVQNKSDIGAIEVAANIFTQAAWSHHIQLRKKAFIYADLIETLHQAKKAHLDIRDMQVQQKFIQIIKDSLESKQKPNRWYRRLRNRLIGENHLSLLPQAYDLREQFEGELKQMIVEDKKAPEFLDERDDSKRSSRSASSPAELHQTDPDASDQDDDNPQRELLSFAEKRQAETNNPTNWREI